MVNKIRILSLDPSTSAFGICKADLCLETSKIEIITLHVEQTESEKLKGVNKSSDDIRRARLVCTAMLEHAKDCRLAISEIPFYNPTGYAAANYNSGLVVGVLASLPIPLIQVFPRDVKLAAVGHPQASKEEMIAWAMNLYPTAPWRMRTLKGKTVPLAVNEHLADAIAALHAGIESQQFQQAAAMYRSMAA
jgi:hypothetical protein